EGVAMHHLNDPRKDLAPLFETIVESIPEPRRSEGAFQMLVSTVDFSPYLGRLAIGRIERGTARGGEPIVALHPDGETEAKARISRLFLFDGLERVEAESAEAGDIIAIAGLPEVEIGSTICDVEQPEALQGIRVEEPTVSVDFMVNNSP